jgi:excisionase family DNA binding protein
MATATVESSAVPAANPSAVNSNSLLLNLPAASSVVGLTTWQLRGLISNGEIPVVRVGRKLYVRRQTLTRWAERAEARHRT